MKPEYDKKQSPEYKAKVLKMAREAWRVNHEHWSKWRQEAQEDYDFVSGDQWADEDKQVLREEMRPAAVFNRVGPVIDAISGQEVSNRQEVMYYPREMGDAAANEVLTAAAQWVRDNCDAADEESDAFLDSIICGVGVTETKLSYDMNLDGDIVVERVDPMEMWPDARAKKRNFADARNVLRAKDYSVEEFEEMWPDADLQTEGSPTEWNAETPDLDPVINDPDSRYEGLNNGKTGKQNKFIRVVEYQWYEREEVFRVRDPQTGQIATMDKAEFGQVRVQLAQFGMKLKRGRDYTKQKKRVYKRAFLAGATVLECGDAPVQKGFSYNFMTAKRDRNNNTWYGIVRAMKDPQRWANKFFSQILNIINSNSKGGVMYQSGAIDDIRAFEKNWALPNGNVEVTNLDQVREKPQSKFPVGIDRMMEFTISSIRDVTGVNLEMLGLANRDQAGVLENARKEAGLTILATTFDALKRYRKMQGRTMLDFIQEYISDGRLIRVVGQEGAQYVPLIRTPGLIEYDVIVDDSPESPNQKQQIWGVIQSMMPVIMETPASHQLLLEAIKYSPLPSSLVAKVQQIMQQGSEPSEADKLEAQREQAEIKKLESEAAENMADIQIKQAKAQAAGFEAQTKRQESQQQNMLEAGKLALQARQANAPR